VALNDLRNTLSVLYLTSTRLRINIPVRQWTYIMSRVRMLRVRTFSRAGKAINLVFIQDTHTPTLVAPLPMIAPTMTPFTIATITITSQAPILPTTVPSTIIQNLPSFGSLFGFDNRLRTLKANFSDFMQTNQFAGEVSAILGIVQRYIDQRMNEAVKVAVQIQSDCLRDEAQIENDEFLKSVVENMQKIIKEQVKEQVKVQISKILPRIEQAVNEQLEAEVLTRSSHSSK
nr:hypothetical protein [Tanacetum cinerariifolium]